MSGLLTITVAVSSDHLVYYRSYGQSIGKDSAVSSTTQLPLGSLPNHHSISNLRRLVAYTALQGQQDSPGEEGQGESRQLEHTQTVEYLDTLTGLQLHPSMELQTHGSHCHHYLISFVAIAVGGNFKITPVGPPGND